MPAEQRPQRRNHLLDEPAHVDRGDGRGLVGHDPDFSDLLEDLTDAPVTLRKCALARVDGDRPLQPGSGTLRWLLPPDVLEGRT